MQVNLTPKVEKFLTKQETSDKVNINFVRLFIDEVLANAENPCALENASKIASKKGQGNFWRWKLRKYRIIGEVKSAELVISIIEINRRNEKSYK